MKAATFAGPGAFELKDIDPPQPGPGEALVRVRNVGVCGSDLHFFRGEFPVPPGFILGHECAGEVAALGEGVTGFEPGDRVALELFTVCLTCAQCRMGNYHLCPSRKAKGLDVPGGLCEYMTVPSYAMYPLPPEVDFALGALVEPLAVGVHGLRLVDLRFGEKVAILGAGTIGLLAIATARAMGATHIAVTARHPHQREMARALGADAVYDATSDGIATMAADLSGADVVVETVGGHADTLGHAMMVAAPRARISVLGAFTQPVQIHPIFFYIKEVRLVGSNCYGRGGRQSDYELALDIMRRNTDLLRRLITHRFPLERIDEAYAAAGDKRSGAIKVQIEV